MLTIFFTFLLYLDGNSQMILKKHEAMKNINKQVDQIECPQMPEGAIDLSTTKEYPTKKHLYGCNVKFDQRVNGDKQILSLYSCTFNNIIDSSTEGGGAIYIFTDGKNTITKVNLTIEQCSFEKCQSTKGGAISISTSQNTRHFLISNCIFKENQASENGGAICFKGIFSSIEHCQFINNRNQNSGEIYYESGGSQSKNQPMRIQNSKFEHSNDESSKYLIFIKQTKTTSFLFNDNTIKLYSANNNIYLFNIEGGLNNLSFSNNCISPSKNQIAESIVDDITNGFSDSCEPADSSEPILVISSDEQVEETSSDEQIEATSSDEQIEATSSDEQIEATSSDEKIEATSSDEKIEETSSDEQIEETSSNEQIETTSSDEQIEETSSNEQIEATSSNEQIEETSSDEHIIITTSTSTQTPIPTNTTESDDLLIDDSFNFSDGFIEFNKDGFASGKNEVINVTNKTEKSIVLIKSEGNSKRINISTTEDKQSKKQFVSPTKEGTEIYVMKPSDGYGYGEMGIHANTNLKNIILPLEKVPLNLFNDNLSNVSFIIEQESNEKTISLNSLIMKHGSLELTVPEKIDTIEFITVDVYNNERIQAKRNNNEPIQTKIDELKLNSQSQLAIDFVNISNITKLNRGSKLQVHKRAIFNDETKIELTESSFIDFGDSLIDGICKEIKLVSQSLLFENDADNAVPLMCGSNFNCQSWKDKYAGNDEFVAAQCIQSNNQICLAATRSVDVNDREAKKKGLSSGVIVAIVVAAIVVVVAIVLLAFFIKRSRDNEKFINNIDTNNLSDYSVGL